MFVTNHLDKVDACLKFGNWNYTLSHVASLFSKLVSTRLFTNSLFHLCIFIYSSLFQIHCSTFIIVAYHMRSEHRSLEGLNSVFLEREHVPFHLL